MCERCGERPAQDRVLTLAEGSVAARRLCAVCRDAEAARVGGADGLAFLRHLLDEQRHTDS
jgi:hypothetical protein